MKAPVLITGGAQRLGLAVAQSLLEQNIPVVFTYRTRRPAIDALERSGAAAIQADFSTQAGIERAIVTIQSQCKALSAIIHNASDWDAESDDTANHLVMDKMIQVHVQAPYQINLALAPLLESKDGFTDIIHMTDFVQSCGSAKHIAYAASKAALHNLTLSFARKLAPHTKVNSIAPALVMFNEWDDNNYREKAKKKSLLGKVPGAQEAVKAVNYLLSADYVTGQTIHLNGGRHLVLP